jgi:hypothetical protein
MNSSKRLKLLMPADKTLSLEVFSDALILGPGMLLGDALFNKLKDRAEAVTDENLDKDIIPLIRVMNQIEGIATIWACSGHDATWYQRLLGKERKDRGYIFFVGHVTKLKSVDTFIRYLVDQTWDSGLPITGVVFSSLHHPPVDGFEDYGRYPGFFLEWEFDNVRERKLFLSQMTDVIKRFK